MFLLERLDLELSRLSTGWESVARRGSGPFWVTLSPRLRVSRLLVRPLRLVTVVPSLVLPTVLHVPGTAFFRLAVEREHKVAVVRESSLRDALIITVNR